MYLPKEFREERVPVLHEAIREAALGTLVTLGADGLEASHVPMLLDPEPAPYGTLTGHIARANGQWQRVDGGVAALAIFLGPEAYVSPGWYATKQQTGRVVPTWNYVAVHATGGLQFFEDAERLLALVTRLTPTHEATRPAPWAVTDAPPEFVRAQLKGIVGFELRIERLEGKWKLSQNRPAEDRAGVVDGLRREGGPDEAAVAALMETAERERDRR
jgi:transcriptional regulator